MNTAIDLSAYFPRNPRTKGITFLSFGGGQDSTEIIVRLLEYKDCWDQYVGDDHFLVVMSDTGDEYDYTYAHVERVKKYCEGKGIEFYHIKTENGYHTPAHPNILASQLRTDEEEFEATVPMKGQKWCTDKQKIGPIYKFMDEYVNALMGYGFKHAKTRGCGKRAMHKFRNEVAPINVLIGFAEGEEGRIERAMKLETKALLNPKDWQSTIRRIFPLKDWGLDREACITHLDAFGWEVLPSQCMFCPYQTLSEILWLHRKYPDRWDQWVAIEQAKFVREAARAKITGKTHNNAPVMLDASLPKMLAKAEAKYGHLTDDELYELKKRHGCETAF